MTILAPIFFLLLLYIIQDVAISTFGVTENLQPRAYELPHLIPCKVFLYPTSYLCTYFNKKNKT